MKCVYCKQPARLVRVKPNPIYGYRVGFCDRCLRFFGNRRDSGKGQKANLDRRDEFFKQGVLRATYYATQATGTAPITMLDGMLADHLREMYLRRKEGV